MNESQRERPLDDVDRIVERESEADERERLADEREVALDARERRTQAREASTIARGEKTDKILAEADDRDDEADERDTVADRRERAASLDSFLGHQTFDAALDARYSAATDRIASKANRTSSAEDRSELTADDPATSDSDD
jgi:hypothetical protein